MKRSHSKCLAQAGFTLIELVISMAVFLVVLIIASDAFNKIVSQSAKYSKMEESNIEGVIGLEIMRHDLEQIGAGLPWAFKSVITYGEATDNVGLTLNDAPSAIPRAFVGQKALGAFTSDYIGVKGVTVSNTKASQRWTYIPYLNYSTSTGPESRPIIWPSNNLQSTSPADRVIVIRHNFNDSSDDHLLLDSGGIFFSNYYTNGNFADDFLPTSDQQTHMVYGIVNSSSNQPRMPFNRADFFIKVPDATTASALPQFCAPSTGVLYKATVNHNNNSGTSGGGYNYTPLLDCVADMQVVMGWDSSDGGSVGSVDVYSSLPLANGTVVSSVTSLAGTIQGYLTNAKDLREHLKVVKIYLLAQEGKVDTGYNAPASIEVGDHLVDGLYPIRTFSLTATQRHYRWKLYRIIARPKNLSSNQR
ncbi:MAG: prepilin-type N-terminal cleavage/methylation domain-containing protein [Deltaproteobacteria bacterium]